MQLMDCSGMEGIKIIILMSFTAAAKESREMFNLLCRGNVFFNFFFFLPTVGPISDTALGWPQISRATAQPSEPECSHARMSAVIVMRKLTWHFCNPVHCRLPIQLSSTVIESQCYKLKCYAKLCFFNVEGVCRLHYTSHITALILHSTDAHSNVIFTPWLKIDSKDVNQNLPENITYSSFL